jgi:hypothetical protein
VILQFNQKKNNYLYKGKLGCASRMLRRESLKAQPKVDFTPKVMPKLPAKGKPLIPKLNVEQLSSSNQYYSD